MENMSLEWIIYHFLNPSWGSTLQNIEVFGKCEAIAHISGLTVQRVNEERKYLFHFQYTGVQIKPVGTLMSPKIMISWSSALNVCDVGQWPGLLDPRWPTSSPNAVTATKLDQGSCITEAENYLQIRILLRGSEQQKLE